MATKRPTNSNHALLVALACGATVEVAARQVGISERTAYRRLEQPGFRRELQQMRAGMVQRAAAMLTAASMESVKTLLELQKPAQGGSVWLGAARAIIEIGMKLREMSEIEERIAALEGQLGGTKAAA